MIDNTDDLQRRNEERKAQAMKKSQLLYEKSKELIKKKE